MQLRRYQTDFLKHLLHDDHQASICPVDVINKENLKLYRQHMLANYTRALKLTYPLVHQLIGNHCFRVIACHYAQTHPSASSHFFDYGDQFPNFLTSQTNLTPYPYLTDIARFEWLCHSLKNLMVVDDNHVLYFHTIYPILEIIDLCLGERDDIIDLDKYAEERCYAIKRSETALRITLMTMG